MGLLGDDLVAAPRRERAGELVQQRFAYQALWGLALIFRQHHAGEDYAVLFEFHDDLALLNSSKEPESVEFYQVKTKRAGEWKLADLLRRNSKPAKKVVGLPTPKTLPSSSSSLIASAPLSSSVLGKMQRHVSLFGKRVKSVTLVSNTSCAFNSSDAFKFSACGPAEFEKIVTALAAECDGFAKSDVDVLGFERADLSLNDASAHAKGKLHDLVTSTVGDVPYQLNALFRVAVDECQRKSQFSGDIESFAELIGQKSITRSDVQKWLDAVADQVRSPSWGEVGPELSCGAGEKLRLRSAWNGYRASVLDSGDEALRRARNELRKEIERGAHDGEPDLYALIGKIAEDVRPQIERLISPLDDERLKVMVLYELFTKDKV